MASQAGPVSLHGAGAGANHTGQVVSVAVSRTPTLSNNWPVSFNIMLWIALTVSEDFLVLYSMSPNISHADLYPPGLAESGETVRPCITYLCLE